LIFAEHPVSSARRIQKPDLAVETVRQQENPPTREQGTDRPGRVHVRIGPTRSAVEDTDWHRLAEERFAVETGDALYRRGTIER
jgi:protein required for attachment to host cells